MPKVAVMTLSILPATVSGFRPKWRLGRTAHHVEDISALTDIDDLFESERELRHEWRKNDDDRTGPVGWPTIAVGK